RGSRMRRTAALVMMGLVGGCAIPRRGLWLLAPSTSEAERLVAQADDLARTNAPREARNLYLRALRDFPDDPVAPRALYGLGQLRVDPKSPLRDYAVTATVDAEAALAALGTRGFDAALFDLRMDPIDGIALTRAAHARQPRLPVLIMTAHGTIENAVEAIKEGAFDFLTKPFVTEELRGKLARAMADRRWARDRNLLRTVGETLASAASMERVLSAVAEGTMEATETERTVVFLRESD